MLFTQRPSPIEGVDGALQRLHLLPEFEGLLLGCQADLPGLGLVP